MGSGLGRMGGGAASEKAAEMRLQHQLKPAILLGQDGGKEVGKRVWGRLGKKRWWFGEEGR